jgi:hypothetical protein
MFHHEFGAEMAHPHQHGAGKQGMQKQRANYPKAFKLEVVKSALRRPATNRIKPTCASYPGIEPCQVSTTRVVHCISLFAPASSPL